MCLHEGVPKSAGLSQHDEYSIKSGFGRLHYQASALSQNAIVLQETGQEDEAVDMFAQAFEFEKQAAMKLVDKLDMQPTRAILFRSAAALALKAKLFNRCKQMAEFALQGNPPEHVIEEVKEIEEMLPEEFRVKSNIQLLEGIDFDIPCAPSASMQPPSTTISEYGVSVGDQFYYWGTFKVLAANKVVSTFQEFQNLKLKANDNIRFEFDDNYAHRFDTERHPNIHESMRNGYQFVYTNKETPSFYRESNRNNTKSSRSKPHPKHKNKAQSKARRTNRKR